MNRTTGENSERARASSIGAEIDVVLVKLTRGSTTTSYATTLSYQEQNTRY